MNSKWIDVPSANAPAAEMARQALAARVAKIKRMLPLAADKYREDVEHVHQLRTSCRRAAAAIEAFRPLMSGKPKALDRLLRQIHKAAGPARDTDVLLARFDKQSPAEENLDYVIARLHLQRESAQKALATVAKKSRPGKLKKVAKRTLDSLGRGDRDARQVSFGQFGRDALQAASLEDRYAAAKNGVQAAAREVSVDVPLVVRLEGTNVELGKRILAESGLAVVLAENLADAAERIVKALEEAA